MQSQAKPFHLHELVVGHARVGGLDFAYAQHPTSPGRHAHWFMAVDDAGVALAQPWASGPLVPGEPGAGRDAIAAHLAGMAERPRETEAAKIVRAYRNGPLHEGPRTTALDWLFERGLRIGTGQGEDAERLVAEALEPVRTRLEPRIRLMGLYLSRGRRANLARAPGLDEEAAQARVLRLTIPEATTLSSDHLRFFVEEAIEMPGLRLDAPPSAVAAEALATLGVSRAAIRRLHDACLPADGLVRGLRTLPIDWIPATGVRADWMGLAGICIVLQESRTPEREWRDLLAPARGRWPDFVSRCFRAAFGAGPRTSVLRLSREVRNAADVRNGFAAFLAGAVDEGPDVARRVAEVAHQAVYGRRGLPSLLENSRRWHARFKAAPGPHVAWEPLLPTWKDPRTGIEVAPLSSSSALVEEGEAMGHCVGEGSFALDSLQDRTRILSLRRDGVRLSTAEIALGPAIKAPDEAIVQHHAHGNSEPPKDAVATLRDYAWLDAVLTARGDARSNRNRMPEATEADLAAGLDRWRPYLTGEWKRASLERYREAVAAEPGPVQPEPGPPECRRAIP